jgi:hypothetical protein
MFIMTLTREKQGIGITLMIAIFQLGGYGYGTNAEKNAMLKQVDHVLYHYTNSMHGTLKG